MRRSRNSRRTRRGLPALVVVVLVLAVLVLALEGTPGLPSGLGVPPAPSTPETPPGNGLGFGADAAVQSGWYAVWFTSPQYPDDPRRHRGGLDEKLVALIDRAERSLDVAVYDFDLANVAQAMARAKGRGVDVRMVTDTDTLTSKDEKVRAAFETLEAAQIPIVDDERASIMHDKFTVVDGEWVSTGSWNYTDGDTYRLNNWMGIFHSRDLAARYAAEFEQMFAGQLGAAKEDRNPRPALAVQGVPVRICFSPEGGCADLIVDTIRDQAKTSLYFLAFSFTHDGIGEAIVDKHEAGVDVAGVFETTGSQTPFSEYGKMKRAGLAVYTDGNPYAMHHKVILVDERLVIAGSFNFSQNADQDNDENLLIVEDPRLAGAFKQEFDRVLETAQRPPAR